MLACHWLQPYIAPYSIGHFHYVQSNRLQGAETLYNHLVVVEGGGAVSSRDLNLTRSRGQVVITLIHARPLHTQRSGGISVCVVGITAPFRGIMVT